MSETCGSCKYWMYFTTSNNMRLGECRRFPPSETDEKTGLGMWRVTTEIRWCGEHEKEEII